MMDDTRYQRQRFRADLLSSKLLVPWNTFPSSRPLPRVTPHKLKQVIPIHSLINIVSCIFLFFCFGCFVSGSTNADVANITRVWALDDGEKVRKTDLHFPLANSPYNTVWDGQTIKIFGGKNEIVAFQVFIEANSLGAKGISVTLPSLSNGKIKIANRGSRDPFNYVGKQIEIFTEHYVNVTSRTEASFIWWSDARPMDIYGKEYTGWLPDALIPATAPSGLGGFPIDIEAKTNQGIWIDITIPKNIPAGVYTGQLSILQKGKSIKAIPVSLTVYNFTIPDETHLKNFAYIEQDPIARKHNVKVGTPAYYAIEKRYFQLFHRNRMDLNVNMTLNTLKSKYAGFFNGRAYTPANGYAGPGTKVGAGTYAIGVYDQPRGKVSGFTDSQKAWTTQRDMWTRWFNKNAPNTDIFKYMHDEPISQYGGGPVLQQVQQTATWLHNETKPGKSNYLKAYCTAGGVDGYYYTALNGYIDFWAITGQSGYMDQYGGIQGYTRSKVDLIHQNGGKVAWYNGTRPSSGAHVIDTDAVDFRNFPWIAWKYQLDQYFLWMTDHWYSGSQSLDPFVDPWVRGNKSGTEKEWGNGVLVYPGQDFEFPEDNRKLRGPIASIRLKNWRRGEQDYEYLWLAKNAGLTAQVTKAVSTVIPAAMGEVNQNSPAPWAARGYQYEQQRKNLAILLSNYYSNLPAKKN